MNSESAQPAAVELDVDAGGSTVTSVGEPGTLRVPKGVTVASKVGKGGRVDNSSVGLANPAGGTAWAVWVNWSFNWAIIVLATEV